jgi:hypothetical protein
MCVFNTWLQESVVRGGGIEAILNVMRQHRLVVDIQREACTFEFEARHIYHPVISIDCTVLVVTISYMHLCGGMININRSFISMHL